MHVRRKGSTTHQIRRMIFLIMGVVCPPEAGDPRHRRPSTDEFVLGGCALMIERKYGRIGCRKLLIGDEAFLDGTTQKGYLLIVVVYLAGRYHIAGAVRTPQLQRRWWKNDGRLGWHRGSCKAAKEIHQRHSRWAPKVKVGEDIQLFLLACSYGNFDSYLKGCNCWVGASYHFLQFLDISKVILVVPCATRRM